LRKLFSDLLSSNILRIGIAFAVSLVTLFLAARDVNFQRVGSSLANAKLSFIGFALISVTVHHLSKAVRWKTLIVFGGEEVGYGRILSCLIVGQMFNYFFPARVGDFGRAYVVGGMGPGRSFTLGTVALEKFLDLIIYGVLFIISLYLIPLPNWFSRPSLLFTILVIILVFSIALLVFYRQTFIDFLEGVLDKFSIRIFRVVLRQLKLGLSSFDVMGDRRIILMLFFWSGTIWSTSLLVNHFTLRALQIKLPMLASVLILVALQAGITVPSVPGRIGIFEYICVLVLNMYGVEESIAFSYGVLLHALVLLPITFLGVFLFWVLGLSYERFTYVSSSERK